MNKPTSDWLRIYSIPGKYPKIWSKHIIQKLLLAWSGCRCEDCGELGTNTQSPQSSTGTVLLHVHHLKWSCKHDCRWENLLVVCTGCHTKLHNRRWQPGLPWNPKHGAVPAWAVQRELLDLQGNPTLDADSLETDSLGSAIAGRG